MNNFPLQEAISNYTLYPGFNAGAMGGPGSEFNSPGYNEPVWPALISPPAPLRPLILTADMTDTFDNPPDLIIRRENNTIILPREVRDQRIRGGW